MLYFFIIIFVLLIIVLFIAFVCFAVSSGFDAREDEEIIKKWKEETGGQ